MNVTQQINGQTTTNKRTNKNYIKLYKTNKKIPKIPTWHFCRRSIELSKASERSASKRPEPMKAWTKGLETCRERKPWNISWNAKEEGKGMKKPKPGRPLEVLSKFPQSDWPLLCRTTWHLAKALISRLHGRLLLAAQWDQPKAQEGPIGSDIFAPKAQTWPMPKNSFQLLWAKPRWLLLPPLRMP